METGNVYLLEVFSHWDECSKYMLIDYSTSACSHWETDLRSLITPTLVECDLPTLDAIIANYEGSRNKLTKVLPLSSTTSLLDEYPELFI